MSDPTTVKTNCFVPIDQARGAIGTSLSLDSMVTAVGETADGIDATSDASDAVDGAEEEAADAAAYVDEEDAEEGEEADEEEATGSGAEAEDWVPPILLRYSNLANSVCCSALTVGTGSSSLAETAVISSSSEKRLEQLARSGCQQREGAHNTDSESEKQKQDRHKWADETKHIPNTKARYALFVFSRSSVYLFRRRVHPV
jgi:hypothetical protein